MHVHTYFLHNIILTYRKLLINFIREYKKTIKNTLETHILIYCTYFVRSYRIYFNNIYEVYHVM